MEAARQAEVERLNAEEAIAAAERAAEIHQEEAWTRVTSHWLTALHDSGDPDWQVPAYSGSSHESRFARRVVNVHSRGAALRIERPVEWLPRWAYQLYHGARKRAAAKGQQFRLSYADMLWLVWRSQGRCELSGIPFEMELRGPGERRPFAPSIDRVSCHRGYEYANVRIVATIANLAMNDWGVEPLIRLASALAHRSRTEVE
jgi:hypothetical protein